MDRTKVKSFNMRPTKDVEHLKGTVFENYLS